MKTQNKVIQANFSAIQQIQRAMEEEKKAIQRQNDILRAQLQDLDRPNLRNQYMPPSSTRVEFMTRNNNLCDTMEHSVTQNNPSGNTFTINDGSCSSPKNSGKEANTDKTMTIRSQQSPQNEARQNNQGVQGNTSNVIKTKIDIGKTVKSWGITFSGSQKSSIEQFISRMEDGARSACLSFDDIVPAIPLCLTGNAEHWCSLEKDKWTSWDAFCQTARSWYGTSQRWQQRLQSETIARTQGRDEPVREYITKLRSYMAKINPPWEEARQIDLLHQNMLPELQKNGQKIRLQRYVNVIELMHGS